MDLKQIKQTQIVEMILSVLPATEGLLTQENTLKISARHATKRQKSMRKTLKSITKYISSQALCRDMVSSNLIHPKGLAMIIILAK
jgi:hypothetical protein